MKKTMIAALLMAGSPALAMQYPVQLNCKILTTSGGPEQILSSNTKLSFAPLKNGAVLYYNSSLDLKVGDVTYSTSRGTSLSSGALAFNPQDWTLRGDLASRNENEYISLLADIRSSVFKNNVIYFKGTVHHQTKVNGTFLKRLNNAEANCTLDAN